ncbi:MAG: family class F420-dependent oxidoreductase, partial [Ilumatobacteraceae bacterium]|nr:family class F420-dependent oxidoreductase [Ilumatobacteraceae bacterium]
DRFDEFRNAAADAIRDNVAAGSPLKNRDVFTVPSRLLPAEVVDDAALVGTSAECARGLHSLFDAGADEIVLHGATAEHLGPLVRSFVDA